MDRSSFQGETTKRIVAFLREIGLDVRGEPIGGVTFLPGILIRQGTLVVDETRLAHPGDLLHEAGHLAVVAPERRSRMDANAGVKAHEEMADIAWSWAALTHLRLDPTIVFHAAGYKGASSSLIEALRQACGPGIAILAWIGLCGDPHAGPDARGPLPPFPTMTRWLCAAPSPDAAGDRTDEARLTGTR